MTSCDARSTVFVVTPSLLDVPRGFRDMKGTHPPEGRRAPCRPRAIGTMAPVPTPNRADRPSGRAGTGPTTATPASAPVTPSSRSRARTQARPVIAPPRGPENSFGPGPEQPRSQRLPFPQVSGYDFGQPSSRSLWLGSIAAQVLDSPLTWAISSSRSLWLGSIAAGAGPVTSCCKALTCIAAEVNDPKGFGRCRMAPIKNASAASLHAFVTDHVEPVSTVITDGWQGYRRPGPTWLRPRPAQPACCPRLRRRPRRSCCPACTGSPR